MAEDAILGAKKQICQVTDRMVSDTIQNGFFITLPFNFIQLQWAQGNTLPVCRMPWWSKSLSFGSAAVAIFATSSSQTKEVRSNEAD